jgi:hypothetical protein
MMNIFKKKKENINHQKRELGRKKISTAFQAMHSA